MPLVIHPDPGHAFKDREPVALVRPERIHACLDQRLMLHGKSPVFFPDDAEEEELDSVIAAPISAPQPGRNDLCSCGSGKKFKKCHGLLN